MHLIFTQTQKFVASNAGILLPAFRTTATVGGLVLFSAGLTGLYSPSKLADQFGIPLRIRSSSPKKQNSKNINSDGDQELVKAWITACAGREVFLGSLILSLLYLKEYKALSVALTLGNLIGVVDTIAALKGGSDGAWKKHVITTALLLWVGPLGMFLSGLE
ncbi:hypothetical protein N431DRAFT_428137 [Stipitochalara longipes BDJ]|nr:hypothetical protein N431DRAFT_428137 [Stipitochalara longipes BDJ]